MCFWVNVVPTKKPLWIFYTTFHCLLQCFSPSISLICLCVWMLPHVSISLPLQYPQLLWTLTGQWKKCFCFFPPLYFGSGSFIFMAKRDAIKLIVKQTLPLIWANISMPIKTVIGITYHTVTTYMPGSHEKYAQGYQACIKRHCKASLHFEKKCGH